MRKHNLYVIPRSQAECNQLQSFVHSHGFEVLELQNNTDPTFRIGQRAWFWYKDTYLPNHYYDKLAIVGEQVTPNELALRYNTL